MVSRCQLWRLSAAALFPLFAFVGASVVDRVFESDEAEERSLWRVLIPWALLDVVAVAWIASARPLAVLTGVSAKPSPLVSEFRLLGRRVHVLVFRDGDLQALGRRLLRLWCGSAALVLPFALFVALRFVAHSW